MRTNFVVCLLLSLPFLSAFAVHPPDMQTSKEIEAPSKIKEVTVFLSGAQVFREASFSISKGISTIILDSVAPVIQPKSVQATALGDFLILDVKHNIRYREPMKVKPKVIPVRIQKEITGLEDSLVVKNLEIQQIQSLLKHLERERNMIQKNPIMNGGGKSDSLPVLKDAVQFHREKLIEIEKRIFETKLQQHKETEMRKRMNTRLSELRNYNNNVGQPKQEVRTVHQVQVTVYAEKPVRGKVEVSYLVTLAGWYPTYDLRATSADKPMDITYKASVFQRTGMDWSDVKLTLSTYNQNCFTTKPSMPTWLLDYYVHQPQKAISELAYRNFQQEVQAADKNQASSTAAGVKKEINTGYTTFDDMAEDEKLAVKLPQLSVVNQTFANVEFKVKHDYSVKTDGKQILMLIDQREVEADFNHFVLPKVNKDAFLIASISDWESLDLLPAQANIYFEHTYVGQTRIDPVTMKDTMEVALGRDLGIITTRKKTSDEVKTANLSKRTTRTITFEITVKNMKNVPIEIQVEDQFPVSKNEDIEIKLLKRGGAKVTQSTGKLLWEMELRPNEKRTVEFTYEVEFDKNKQLLQ